MSEQVAPGEVTARAASNGKVLTKLLLFSLCLAVVPISSFYLSKRFVWNGDGTFAAITAVIAANCVLFVYILISIQDDRQEMAVKKLTSLQESRKEK